MLLQVIKLLSAKRHHQWTFYKCYKTVCNNISKSFDTSCKNICIYYVKTFEIKLMQTININMKQWKWNKNIMYLDKNKKVMMTLYCFPEYHCTKLLGWSRSEGRGIGLPIEKFKFNRRSVTKEDRLTGYG